MNFGTILYNIILSPISQVIEIAYRVFDKMFGNTGIALLGVSMTVTLLCLPLYIVAEGWQETERDIQAKMKNGVARIKKAFKGDEQYMILSTYYRQNHYHPIMALRSSFGILIQIPFFFAAYHILSALPDLQGKSFLFIKDMGKPDAIFSIHGFAINILPIAMTLINCISGALYSKGHEIREKIQIYGMAALFLIVLYNSPAGLVVYWTMNNLFSLVKNVFYKMKNPVKVFYYCVVTFLVLVSLYILFGYGGGASFKKRSIAALALLIWIPTPLYLKGINWFNQNPLKQLYNDAKTRFTVFFVSAVGLTLLNGLVLPSSLISSSVQEFCNIDSYTNPTGFLHSSFWMSFGLIIFWPTCVYFLFKEKVQTVLSFLFASFLTGAFVNAFVFTGNYGSMDETLKLIDGFKNPSAAFMFLNILAVFVCLAAVALTIKFNKAKIISTLYLAASFGLVLITIINNSNITKAYKNYEEIRATKQDSDPSSTKFHLSRTQKNIVIFMLDRFAGTYVPDIVENQPQLKEKLKGFKYYPNTLSFNGHTLMGSPGLYGGYDYTPYAMNSRPDVTLKEKHNQALLLLPKILTEQAGFNAVLSDLSWANYSYIADMSFTQKVNPETKKIEDRYENIHGISLLSKYSGDFKKEKLLPGYAGLTLSHVINRNLFWVSLFREVPSPLRSVVYYKGTWWENGVKESSSSFADWFSCLYFMDKITDFESDKPTLSVVTNECTHSSEDISMYDVQLPNPYAKKDGAYIIDAVTLNQVLEYCNYLKENGVFNNTRIIIVSDHGIGNRNTDKYITKDVDGYSKDHLNPVLLVKDFNANDDFATDNSFMTNADVPNIALRDIIENPVNPYTGNRITSESKNNGVQVTIADLFMVHHSSSKNIFTVSEDSWWTVKENIFIDSNWSKVKKD